MAKNIISFRKIKQSSEEFLDIFSFHFSILLNFPDLAIQKGRYFQIHVLGVLYNSPYHIDAFLDRTVLRG